MIDNIQASTQLLVTLLGTLMPSRRKGKISLNKCRRWSLVTSDNLFWETNKKTKCIEFRHGHKQLKITQRMGTKSVLIEHLLVKHMRLELVGILSQQSKKNKSKEMLVLMCICKQQLSSAAHHMQATHISRINYHVFNWIFQQTKYLQ